MTVSVSSAAGVRAVTSAFPQTYDYRVFMALAAIALLTWLNMRGIRESGSIFAIPTYAFVGGVLVIIVIGFMRQFGIFGMAPPNVPVQVVTEQATEMTEFLIIWLVLRAFAAGCTALTGIEAISNGVKAFKPPESRNAAETMVAMAVIAMTLFLGISFLATLRPRTGCGRREYSFPIDPLRCRPELHVLLGTDIHDAYPVPGC
ncbi:MAG: amino acid permease [Chloroflexota bacterium]